MSDHIQDPIFDAQGRVIHDAYPNCAAVNAGMEPWEWEDITDTCNLGELKTMMMENHNKPMAPAQIKQEMAKRRRVGSEGDLLRALKTLPYNDEWMPDRMCTRKRSHQLFQLTPNTVKNELMQSLSYAADDDDTTLFATRFKTVVDSKTISLKDLEDARLIHTAIRNDNVDMLKLLLAHVVSVHTVNTDQETALQMIAKSPCDSIRGCLDEYRGDVYDLLTGHVTVSALVRVCMSYY